MRSTWFPAVVALCSSVFGLFGLFGFAGCNKAAEVTAPLEKICVPGTVYSCVRGSCTGHQSCTVDGTEYSSCVCNSDDEPLADGGAESVDASMPAPTDAATPKDAGKAPDARVDAQQPGHNEQCDNGKDDDGDGQVDCADPDCSERTCVAEAPRGWKGPIALRLDAADSGCGPELSELAFEAGTEPENAAATCSSCTCSGGDTACAAFVDFGTGNTPECGGTTCTTSINQSCTEIMPPCLAGLATAYLQTKLPSAVGACTPSMSTMTASVAAWKASARACTAANPQRAGCKSGRVCLPAELGSGFEANYCVWQEGDTDCPNTTFTDKQVYYRELEDTRSCSACSCSGPNCSYSWKIFNSGDVTCGTPLLELNSPNQCVQVNPAADKLRVGASIAGDGKCTASGGKGEGSVTAKKPVTVCCEP